MAPCGVNLTGYARAGRKPQSTEKMSVAVG